jgi:hypothetical protein
LLAKFRDFPEMGWAMTDKQAFPRDELWSVSVAAVSHPFERVEAGPTDVNRPNRLPESLSP